MTLTLTTPPTAVNFSPSGFGVSQTRDVYKRQVIPTGIAIAIENNETAAFVYARSGLGIKHGISPVSYTHLPKGRLLGAAASCTSRQDLQFYRKVIAETGRLSYNETEKRKRERTSDNGCRK